MKKLALILLYTPLFAIAQDTLYQTNTISIPPSITRFGYQIYPGDFNGDGFTDLAIGEPWFGANDKKHGAVHFYHGDSSGFSKVSEIQYNEIYSAYGFSIAAGDIDNDGFDDVIVGAPWNDNGSSGNQQLDYGAIFIYKGSSTGVNTSAHFTKFGAQVGQQVGRSLTFSNSLHNDAFGDFISSSSGENNTYTNTGSIDVWYGSSDGYSWTTSKVRGNLINDYQGLWVNNAGDVNGDGFEDIIVGGDRSVKVYLGGSSFINPNVHLQISGEYPGIHALVSGIGDVNGDGFDDVVYTDINTKVHVLHGSSIGLTSSPNWSLENLPASEYPHAGKSIMLSEIGDWNKDGYDDFIAGYNDEYAYIINGSANGLENEVSLVLTNTAGHDFKYIARNIGDNDGNGFFEVALSSYSDNSVYTFELVPQDLIFADWHQESDQADAEMGYYISTAGDVNGDNIDDFLVGSYVFDQTFINNGKVSLFYGSSSGPANSSDWEAFGGQHNEFFGASSAEIGDVNNDGYDDFMVGAFGYDGPGLGNEGRAYIFLGGFSGPSSTPNKILSSGQAGASFGNDLASLGDVNNDGYLDIGIAAYLYDDSYSDEGAVYVYYGNSTGISDTNFTILKGNQAQSQFGKSISSIGDINLDGYADLIVGAPKYDDGQVDEGAAFIFLGSATGITDTATWSFYGNEANALLGFDVAGGGDFNGDGKSDFAVSAFGMNNSGSLEGRIFGFYGQQTNIPAISDFEVSAFGSLNALGKSLSIVKDLNGDGYDELIAGAESTNASSGAVLVYSGDSTGLISSPWSYFSPQEGARFGWSVADVGDLNDDGVNDIGIGATRYSNNPDREGGVFVFYGEDSLSHTSSARFILDQTDETETGNLEEKAGLNIFPNPSGGKVNIVLNGNDIRSIQLLDISGSALFSKEFKAGLRTVELDFNDLNFKTGIIRIYDMTGNVYNRKIIKH